MVSKVLEKKLERIIFKSLKEVRPNLGFTIGDSYTFGTYGFIPLDDPIWNELYIDIKLTCQSINHDEGTLFDPGVGKALGISQTLMKEIL